jgi:hypothetical protein
MIILNKNLHFDYKKFILFFLIIFCFYFFWLLNFLPAIMMPDTFDQWRQMESFTFNDWHPVFHSLFFWFVTRFWNSPSAIAIVQIIMFSSIVSWILILFIQNSMPFKFALMICLLLALSPLNASMSVYIVKDVPFALSFLLLNGVLFKIVFFSDDVTKKDNFLYFLLLPLALILTSFFRHNGLPVAISVALLIILLKRNKQSYLMFGIYLLLFLLISFPLYKNILKVNTDYKNFLLSSNLLSLIAAHKNSGTFFKNEENIFLENLIPSNTKWIHNPTNVSNTITQIGLPKLYFLADDKNSRTLISIAVKVTLRNPSVSLKQVLDMSNILFYPAYYTGGKEPPSHLLLSSDNNKVITNNVTATPSETFFPQRTLFPTLDVKLVKFLDSFRNVPLVASPAFFFYSFIFLTLFICYFFKSFKYLILIFPTVSLVIFLVPLLGSNEFRYYYPIYLTAHVFLPFILFKIYCYYHTKLSF